VSRRKPDSSSIATFADHEVIAPPHRLRAAVTQSAEPGDDPVARAEAAMAQLSNQFAVWMTAECDRLEAARQQVKHRGFDRTTHQALFRAAHDIKGEAATFGYPAVARVADSLARLLEHTPDMSRIPILLVEQHVDAVRAIAREYGRADLEAVAHALTAQLRDVTDGFLRRENEFRPDYLESIFAA
jgi:chemotaxis protein histidine kinase CheA